MSRLIVVATSITLLMLGGCKEILESNLADTEDGMQETAGGLDTVPHDNAFEEAFAKSTTTVGKADIAGKAPGDNVLVNQLQCSAGSGSYPASIRIRAQNMTSTQLSSNCGKMRTVESRFHGTFGSRSPVSGDLNTALDVAVFDSSSEYQRFSPGIFGNSTNNGGIYLEGTPSQSGNQARFIAYEYSPGLVWNLEHEFSHYLDGRFNMWGGFCDYPVGSCDSYGAWAVWWVEGFAEYNDKQNNNTAAINLARNKTYSLSTMFRTSYSGGSDRVYRWGYLAVRFMFERHRSDVNTIVSYFRSGSYSTYISFLSNTIGTRYDTEWYSWLDTVGGGSSGDGDGDGDGDTSVPNACASQSPYTGNVLTDNAAKCVPAGTASNSIKYFYIYSTGATRLVIKTAHGTGNGDLYYNASTWATSSAYNLRSINSGNSESITVNSPGTGYRYMSVVGAHSGLTIVADLQ